MQVQARVLDAIKGLSPTGELVDTLFDGYDRRIRPFDQEGIPVIIDMSIVLGILIELKWQDPKLAWNPAYFNNITQLVIPQSMIWLPKLFVYNSMTTIDMLTPNRYDVRLYHDGTIKINIPQYVTCICRLSIEQFPFDTQYCAVALASPLLTVEEMDVISHGPPQDSYFAGNSEWQLMNVTVRHLKFLEESEYRAEVHYIFELKRRPMFYITVIVVPIFLISMLSILGIFTPGATDGPKSEKVSLGLGSLMATTVLLGIVAGAMPKSNSIPLLGYYILSVIVLCAVAVGISIAFFTLSRKLVDKGRIPSNFTYRFMLIRPTVFHTKRLSTFERQSIVSVKPMTNGKRTSCAVAPNGLTVRRESVKSNGIVTDNGFDIDDLGKIYNSINYLVESQVMLRNRVEKEQTRLLIEKEWTRIFARLDYFNLVVFQSLNVVSLVFFLQFAWAPAPPMREPIV
uniref:Neurotransmitter-gated ion-channel ligand-binding domain-containing protein n=1 Tax=Panagrellus redivivus TaxID=6233 RepID=A0A7E4V033_PANRE